MRGSKKPETPRQRNTKERLERAAMILALAEVKPDKPHRTAEERVLMWELLDLQIAELDMKIEEAREQLKK